MAHPRLVVAIREFAGSILNPYDQQELLRRLTDHATALTGSQGAGIMLSGRHEAELAFAAASDDRVVEVELTQDATGAGPCYDAFVTNRMVVVDDIEPTDRWPEYRRRALALGFRSVLGVPMNAWGQTIGGVNIYRCAPGSWGEDAVEAAEIVTSMGAGYVLHADQLRAQHDLATQLQTALRNRDVIGQAKGILMARRGIDAATAFEELRVTSQVASRKLRDVARDLVEGAVDDGEVTGALAPTIDRFDGS